MEEILVLDNVPVLCNVLYSTAEEARSVSRGKISLYRCLRCGHGWNAAFDSSLVDYDVPYENSLCFSKTFQEYVEGLIRELIRNHNLRGRVVVEIGCGKGEFLSLLCGQAQCRGIGFDPSLRSEVGGQSGPSPGVRLIPDYFSVGYVPDGFDFVVCRHVLEHVTEPGKLVNTVVQLARHDREVSGYFEVPNFGWIQKAGSIWDVIYEHPHYFTRLSLEWLFAEAGLDILSIASRFGEQFLSITFTVARDLRHRIAVVRQVGIPSRSVFASSGYESPFGETTRLWKRELRHMIGDRGKIVVWGAGSKAVTLLNVVGFDEGRVVVVDVNPRKQGSFVAGTGYRIDSPEVLKNTNPAIVLVMNPQYESEVRSDLEIRSCRASVCSLV